MGLSERQYQEMIAVYPRRGVRRWLFKAPIYAWRLGLSALLPPTFALLTTRGRKSGLPRRTPVESNYIQGNYYIVSGWGTQADWFKNIQAHPEVTLQIPRKGALGGLASHCTDEATLRLVFRHFQRSPAMQPYLAQLGIAFNEEAFVANRERVHIVKVTPQPTLSLPPQRADLAWLWAVVAGLVVLARLWRRTNRVRSA
jgi:deazaflavin-dependent oxidoreductase (nitroreductase family)